MPPERRWPLQRRMHGWHVGTPARAHTGTGAHHRFQRNACRITIKALLDGLTRFYNPGPFAASSAAASSLPSSADAAASSSTARHLG